MKRFAIVPALLLLMYSSSGQVKFDFPIADSTAGPITSPNPLIIEKQAQRRKMKSLIFPSLLITYGIVALESEPLRSIDYSTKQEIREDYPRFHTKVDNYLQYAPAFTVCALNVAGIKGKNVFQDRTMIFLLASAISGTAVQSLKSITNVPRPNGDSRAFPSGHTATAFTGAEFLRQEYKDVSPFYGVLGYVMATGTGILRVYNNAHWLRDVVPGAGIGILSTRIAYWIYPTIKKKIFPHSRAVALVIPSYEWSGSWGGSLLFAIQL